MIKYNAVNGNLCVLILCVFLFSSFVLKSLYYWNIKRAMVHIYDVVGKMKISKTIKKKQDYPVYICTYGTNYVYTSIWWCTEYDYKIFKTKSYYWCATTGKLVNILMNLVVDYKYVVKNLYQNYPYIYFSLAF